MKKFACVFSALLLSFSISDVSAKETMLNMLDALTQHIAEAIGGDARVVELSYSETGELIAAVRGTSGSISYTTCRYLGEDVDGVECYTKGFGRKVYQLTD